MPPILSFSDFFHRPAEIVAQAPGRVNLLGEHVDYNDGPVLPAAIHLSVKLSAAPQEDLVTIYAMDLDQKVSFRLDNLEHKVDIDGKMLPSWALYPAGVAWALQEAGFPLGGIQAVYTSDVPIGAGLSSSAAVEVAFAAAWQASGGWDADRMELAQLCQKAENDYIGVSSGLMDQFASMHGVEDNALYFDTRSLEWEPVPMPAGTALVIADSGVRRSLASSAYNERRASCEQAVAILKKHIPELRSLRDISPPLFAAYREFLPDVVGMRAEHVIKEIHRVETAVTALRRGEAASFGALMFAGHASLRDLYEVSIPELDLLVRIARDLPGCLGARLTGAGFGGCTINLVEEEQAGPFMASLRETYHFQTRRDAAVYLTRASAGAAAKRV